MSDDFVEQIERDLVPAVDETIRLAGCTVRLVGTNEDFPPLRYFSLRARVSPEEPPDYEVWCIPLDEVEIDREAVLRHVDPTARAKSFANGYYVTEFFGPPIYMITRGNRYFLFGDNFERVIWPYFVKYFLMRFSIDAGLLHLKAAALTIGDVATLIVGRGGSGKTVFLTQLCRRGAGFVTNSHALVANGRVEGVASAMRLRRAPWVTELTGSVETSPGLMSDHVILDPFDVFDDVPGGTFEIRNVCFIEYRGADSGSIIRLDADDAYDCAEEFALALNVYRLEEDLLDLVGGDYRRFGRHYADMKERLRAMILRSRCYWISCDMFDRRSQDEVLSVLSPDSRR